MKKHTYDVLALAGILVSNLFGCGEAFFRYSSDSVYPASSNNRPLLLQNVGNGTPVVTQSTTSQEQTTRLASQKEEENQQPSESKPVTREEKMQQKLEEATKILSEITFIISQKEK